MLLEITKPELVLEEQNIISTLIVFGGAKIVEESSAQIKIDEIKKLLEKFYVFDLVLSKVLFKISCFVNCIGSTFPASP